jgi:hypothetical protein
MLFVFPIIIILTYGTYHITTITREGFNRIIQNKMWDGIIHGAKYYYKGIEIFLYDYSCDDKNDYNDNRKRRKWLWSDKD